MSTIQRLPAPYDRRAIIQREYTDLSSVTELYELREKLAATVEVVKRAGLDSREFLWVAREAERVLGKMLMTAREVGDLTTHKRGEEALANGVQTLSTLGVPFGLAHMAKLFALVPDVEWERWHESDVMPSAQRMIWLCKSYIAQQERALAGPVALTDEELREAQLRTERSARNKAIAAAQPDGFEVVVVTGAEWRPIDVDRLTRMIANYAKRRGLTLTGTSTAIGTVGFESAFEAEESPLP